MIKILFVNEEGCSEIIESNRVYVDPDAPTDILIVENSELFKLRIRFTDVDEANSFMDILFECDKVNLKEIIEDNPELSLTIEEDEDMEAVFDVLDNILNSQLEDVEYGELEDEESGNE